MLLSLVVAASENNVIGKDNRLLWHLPNDMKFFKNVTWAMPVIMGRKTFEALGKPLTGRLNIVITRQAEWEAAGTTKAANLDDAIQKAAAENFKEASVIGGGEIYKLAMPVADKIYLTRVHAQLEGDTVFPLINENEWKLISQDDLKKDDKHLYDYSFQVWERK